MRSIDAGVQDETVLASYSPIGIDIGTADIKMVQLVREKKQWVPFAVARHQWNARSVDDLQFDDCFTAAVRSAFENGEFKGKRAIISLSLIHI